MAMLTHGEAVPGPLDLALEVADAALEQDVLALARRHVRRRPLHEELRRVQPAVARVQHA